MLILNLMGLGLMLYMKELSCQFIWFSIEYISDYDDDMKFMNSKPVEETEVKGLGFSVGMVEPWAEPI